MNEHIKAEIASNFLENLLNGNKTNCSAIAKQYLDINPSIMDLYEDILKNALYTVGILWETNKISVATEHLATAITEGIFNEYLDRNLKKTQERFELVIEASDQGIWDWDIENNKVFFSEQWKKQIGYDDTELENSFDTWVEHLHPDDKERCLNAVKTYVEQPDGHFYLEFRFRHKDGSYRWMHNKAASIINDKGKAIRMFGSHSDITERKRIELELAESEERFKALHNASFGGIVMYDKG